MHCCTIHASKCTKIRNRLEEEEKGPVDSVSQLVNDKGVCKKAPNVYFMVTKCALSNDITFVAKNGLF